MRGQDDADPHAGGALNRPSAPRSPPGVTLRAGQAGHCIRVCRWPSPVRPGTDAFTPLTGGVSQPPHGGGWPPWVVREGGHLGGVPGSATGLGRGPEDPSGRGEVLWKEQAPVGKEAQASQRTRVPE